MIADATMTDNRTTESDGVCIGRQQQQRPQISYLRQNLRTALWSEAAMVTQTSTVQTNKPLESQAPSKGQLQRLGFVPQYSQFAYTKLGQLYSAGKGYVPSSFAKQVKGLEDLYQKHGVPLVTLAGDSGKEVLLLVDGRVSPKNLFPH